MKKISAAFDAEFLAPTARQPTSGGSDFMSRFTARDRLPGRHGLGIATLLLLLLLKPMTLMGQPFAYVTAGGGIVSVINTSTNTVVGTVNLGSLSNHGGVALTPDGNFAYVVEPDNGVLLVINTFTNQVVATVPMRGYARDVAITPDGNFAYVTNTRRTTYL